MKLRYFILTYAAMLPLLPISNTLAAGAGREEWHNWVYMFGHAGPLHYALNGIGWLMMWKIATPGRTTAAWIMSALAMYVIPAEQPVLGWSAVIYWYLGMCMVHKDKTRRIKLILFTLTGFLLPNIAAWLHLTMLAAGWLSRKTELAWKRTI